MPLSRSASISSIPAAEVVFRMQFTSSLGTAFFLDKTIPASEDFVAYDFPLEDFHKSAPDSGEYFSGVTDPAHADVWETLFVYVDAETELKLFLDDLSYVKYDYTPPATTTTETPTTTTTEPEDTTGAFDQEADHGRQDHCGRCFGNGRQ